METSHGVDAQLMRRDVLHASDVLIVPMFKCHYIHARRNHIPAKEYPSATYTHTRLRLERETPFPIICLVLAKLRSCKLENFQIARITRTHETLSPVRYGIKLVLYMQVSTEKEVL